jgi:hypothetical protein
VFPQQGHYAADPDILTKYAHGDIQLARIGDLVGYAHADLISWTLAVFRPLGSIQIVGGICGMCRAQAIP